MSGLLLLHFLDIYWIWKTALAELSFFFAIFPIYNFFVYKIKLLLEVGNNGWYHCFGCNWYHSLDKGSALLSDFHLQIAWMVYLNGKIIGILQSAILCSILCDILYVVQHNPTAHGLMSAFPIGTIQEFQWNFVHPPLCPIKF